MASEYKSSTRNPLAILSVLSVVVFLSLVFTLAPFNYAFAGTVPDQVTGLSITQNMSNDAILDWDDTSGATQYQIYRTENFTGLVNGTWQYKEMNYGSFGGTPDCDWDSVGGVNGGIRMEMQGSSVRSDGCTLAIILPTSLINNTDVYVDWTGTETGSGSSLSTQIAYSNKALFRDPLTVVPVLHSSDGFLEGDFNVVPQFPILNPTIIKDNAAGWSRTIDKYSPATSGFNSYDTNTENPYTTLQIVIEDVNIISNPITTIHSINITDRDGNTKFFWNFTGATQNIENTGTCPNPSSDCDFGTIEASSFIAPALDFELIGISTVSSFTDITTLIATQYNYKVGSNNTAGFGDNSTIVDFGLIHPILNLNATALNPTSIQLNWNRAITSHPSDPLTGVLIQRNGTTITTVDELDTSFVDTGLLPGTTYVYQVKGVSSVSTGIFSDSSSAMTDALKCNGLDVTIIGTSGDDILDGTSGDDVIAGLEGNDIINGKGGDDTICGNDGNDQLFGNGGSDTILGGADADFIEGNDGNDTIFGEDGDDIISGKKGADTINGDNGNDLIFGNDGADTINGGEGNDTIEGGATGDMISGNAGNDKLIGDAGNDTLDGGTNDPLDADICVGGQGGDTETNCEVIF